MSSTDPPTALRPFCTYFDSNYLSRGLALWESVQLHAPGSELFVLCLDDGCFETLNRLKLPRLTPIALAEFEAAAPDVAATRSTRSLIEYYFTITPALPAFVLAQRPDSAFVSYIDADIRLFASLDPLWSELGDGSVAITEHRFPPKLRHFEQWGRFNVGLVVFRNDERARAVLRWWRERCVEWCYDVLENDRFADQKYLDQWPARFDGVIILQHAGANVAPWNAGRYEFRVVDGVVSVDDAPLLFYHFHRLRHWRGGIWRLGFYDYRTRPSRTLAHFVYRPYLLRLGYWNRRLAGPKRVLRDDRHISDLWRLPIALARGDLLRMPYDGF